MVSEAKQSRGPSHRTIRVSERAFDQRSLAVEDLFLE